MISIWKPFLHWKWTTTNSPPWQSLPKSTDREGETLFAQLLAGLSEGHHSLPCIINDFLVSLSAKYCQNTMKQEFMQKWVKSWTQNRNENVCINTSVLWTIWSLLIMCVSSIMLLLLSPHSVVVVITNCSLWSLTLCMLFHAVLSYSRRYFDIEILKINHIFFFENDCCTFLKDVN